MATPFHLLEERGEEACAFPIVYYDDHDLFPSLLPFIRARLPLDGVAVKNPFSPHAAVYCNTLRLKFIHRESLSDTAVPLRAGVTGSSSTFAAAAAAAAAKLAGASYATSGSVSGAGSGSSHAPVIPPATTTATSAATPLASSSGIAQPGQVGLSRGRQGRSGAAPIAAATTRAAKPFVYLQILHLENIDDYKTHHRRMLRAWVDNLTEQHDEWLVLYVTPFSESETQSRAFRKVLDKLKSDLNPPGSRSRERFLRVPIDPTGQYSHAPVFHDLWNAFMLRLKEALAAAVEGRYVELEEEVQRRTQVAEPRFCAVFTAKEDLAQLHALCNRPEEALAVLDSLDLLRNSSGERGGLYDFYANTDVLPWQTFFQAFGFASTDAEVPVLLSQPRLARLQAALREDSISYIDFRQYLFARQAELLLRLNRLEELGARAVQLVSSVYKELLSRNITTGAHTWALLLAVNFAGYLVALSAVQPERCATPRDVPEATPRSITADEGSPWLSNRQHDFTGSPSSTGPAVSPYGSVSAHPLLPLKYPSLASAARTLHRFTPLQFSFSPTRRGHASQRGRGPTASSPQTDAPTALSLASGDPVTQSYEGGGAEGSVHAKESLHGSAGGIGSPTGGTAGRAPAPAARYAGILYGVAAQQLQRLIRWRSLSSWYSPLKEIPLVDTNAHQQHQDLNTNVSAEEAVKTEPPAKPAADDGKTSAVPSKGTDREPAPQDLNSEKHVADLGGVDDEPFFSAAETERLNGLLLIVSRKSLLEELQTAATTEDLLAKVFVLAGQQYLNGGYYRHAALLQYRLAAANFRRGCVEECRSSLGRLFAIFLKEPWTELWLACQQLLCKADHCAGDTEAEVRSAYVLSNVRAQYNSTRKLQSRVGAPLEGGQKTQDGATGSLTIAARHPFKLICGATGAVAPQARKSRGAVDLADRAAEGGYEVPSATRGEVEKNEVLVNHPQEFLQRFIRLARTLQAEHPTRPLNDAGDIPVRVLLSPAAAEDYVGCDGATASARPRGAAADSDHAHSAPENKVEAACGQLADARRGAEAAGDEEEESARRMPTCFILSDLDSSCETLCTEDRSLHLSSSPNLYCWAALAAWWPADHVHGGGVLPRGCIGQPALALASYTLAPTSEPPLSTRPSVSSPPSFDGGGSMEGTPYTLTSFTPTTGAATTTSLYASRIGVSSTDLSSQTAGRLAALFSSRRQMLSLLPVGAPMTAVIPSSSLQATAPFCDTRGGAGAATSVLRASYSRADTWGQGELLHGGGSALNRGLSFPAVPRSPAMSYCGPSWCGSPAQNMWGMGAFVQDLLRARRGSVDYELLEHAVVRQLADLLPLYQLPCHPELGPHVYLFAYVATLLRLKPKSIAQVLGQRHRLTGFRSHEQHRRFLTGTSHHGEHSELETVAATEHEEGGSDQQLLSRPRAAVRAASEGTQKRPRGSTNVTDAGITSPAEAATPAGGLGPLNRSGRGFSGGGFREFRWRRSKTLTQDSQAASSPRDAGGSPPGAVKGEQGREMFSQLETNPHSSSSRSAKVSGRVSLLVSRRRRSTMSGAAAPSAVTTTAASKPTETAVRKESVCAEGYTQTALYSTTDAASSSKSGEKNGDAGADTSRYSAVASTGGAAPRLPEQFRSCAQPQLPTTTVDPTSVAGPPKISIGMDCRHLPPLPVIEMTSGRDAATSLARSAGGAAASASHQRHYHDYYQRAPAPESPAGAAALRSRALCMLEMSSMQNVLPSLSVSLGQHIELQLYVHSCLAGPLHADYVAVRLSQLPVACLNGHHPADLGTGVGARIRSEPRRYPSAAGQEDDDLTARAALGPGSPTVDYHVTDLSKSAVVSVSGEDKEELLLNQERAGIVAASMWLVARSGSSSEHRCTPRCSKTCKTAGGYRDVEKEERLLPSNKAVDLVIKPGINRLSLLWSSCIEGVFVLEQICFGVGAATLVQWAGDLPLPEMMVSVAHTMQKVLLTASLQQQQCWHQQKCSAAWRSLSSPATPAAATETDRTIVMDISKESGIARRASVSAPTTHVVDGAAVVDEIEESRGTKTATYVASITKERSDGNGAGLFDERASNIGALASQTHASYPPKDSRTLAVAAGPRGQAQVHLAAPQKEATTSAYSATSPSLLTKRCENPFFQPVGCGNLASANAFEERADPPPWLLQQLAAGCSPVTATLLQPIAPLERMLRPLILEVRSPSTAVQIHVQAASPSDSFLFLDATNFFVVHIDVMPGLFAGPTPCRLRVLQCLLPLVSDLQHKGPTGHLVPSESQMQGSFLLGGAESSALDDIRCHTRSAAADDRRASGSSRIQRQTAAMSNGRSRPLDRGGESFSVGAVNASPELIPKSQGTASAGTWRKYFRENVVYPYRTPQNHYLYRQGSTSAAAGADRTGRSNILLNYGSSMHGLTARAAYEEERDRRSRAVAHTDKDAFLPSPWTPPIRGFNHPPTEGLQQLDDQQLFEAAAVHLRFQWSQAVAQSVDGVPVHRRLSGQEGHQSQHRNWATGAAPARREIDRHTRQSSDQEQSRGQQGRSFLKMAFADRVIKRREGGPAEDWDLGDEADIDEKVDGGVAVILSASHRKHSLSDMGAGGDASGASNAGASERSGEPQEKGRLGYLRICAEDEDGDVLAMVPQQTELGRRRKGSSLNRFDSTQVAPAESSVSTLADACWLELPPFQTSCKILVPVIPVWADAYEEGGAGSFAAGTETGTNVDARPRDRNTFSAADPHVLADEAPFFLSNKFRSGGSLDGISSGDYLDDLRGNNHVNGVRPHYGGRNRLSAGVQESTSPLAGEGRLFWGDRQKAEAVRGREEAIVNPSCLRRLSSSGGYYGYANGVQLRSCSSRALIPMRVAGWPEEPLERLTSEPYMDDFMVPRGFSFRRRRSAFIVSPTSALPAAAEETPMALFDGGKATAEACPETAGRLPQAVPGAQDFPAQSPAARAAQQISMRAMVSFQQRQHEQQHRDRRQEAVLQQQQSEGLQQRFSSPFRHSSPPLEFNVHIVTTLKFYMRTGIPVAAAAHACARSSGRPKACDSAATSLQQKLQEGCPCSIYESSHAGSEILFGSETSTSETQDAQINDLGVVVPTVFPRGAGVATDSTLLRVPKSDTYTSRTDKEDRLVLPGNAADSHVTAVHTGNVLSEGLEGTTPPEKSKDSVAAAVNVADVHRVAGGEAASENATVGEPSARRCRSLSPTSTSALRAPGERLQVDTPNRSGRFTSDFEDAEGLAEDVDEEAFDSVEVCAQETIRLREQQQKQLEALLLQGGIAFEDDVTTTPLNATKRHSSILKDGAAADAGEERKRAGNTRSAGEQKEIQGQLQGQQRLAKLADLFTKTYGEKTESWRSYGAQPQTVMLASTSRVHRLAVRVALQHSERLLHVGKDALLQQVLLSSCCSSAEPVVVESASITRLPSGRSDHDLLLTEDEQEWQGETAEAQKRKDTNDSGPAEPHAGVVAGEETASSTRDTRSQCLFNVKSRHEPHTPVFKEKHHRHKRRQRKRLGTKVSLIAPPPACLAQQMTSFSAPPQQADAVRLNSLLFGERMTALLVHLEHCRRLHRRKNRAAEDTSRTKRKEATHYEKNAVDSAERKGGRHTTSDDSETLAGNSVSRRIQAAFEPRMDAYLLSIHYRFLQQPQAQKKPLYHREVASLPTAAAAGSVGLWPDKGLHVSIDEATTQDTETTEPEEEEKPKEELLVYKIPLVFPVQQFPFSVRFHAPRLGRVSSPLVVCLIFTNYSEVQLDVRHAVSLEFDNESTFAMRAAAESSSLLPLRSNSRSLASRLQLQCSRFYSAAGTLRLPDSSWDGIGMLPVWKGTTTGAGAAAPDEPGKGTVTKKDVGRSSRLGECHDWLMVGSKCRTTTLSAHSTIRVRFQLVPLRAGPLPLPTVRVRIRPSNERQRLVLANSWFWPHATGVGRVADVADESAAFPRARTAAVADKGDKTGSTPAYSPDTSSLNAQNLRHHENEAPQPDTASSDWWLPVPYGDSVTAGGRKNKILLDMGAQNG